VFKKLWHIGTHNGRCTIDLRASLKRRDYIIRKECAERNEEILQLMIQMQWTQQVPWKRNYNPKKWGTCVLLGQLDIAPSKVFK
jgi:hypothetical protein